MADVKKFLDLAGLQVNNDLLKGVISEEDAKILEEAKSYADGKDEAIADAKKAGEDAQSAVEALESGAVADNTSAIEAINNADTGILAQAKEYADGKDEAIEAAKKSGDDAQADVDALEETVETVTSDISTMKGQIEALESGTYDDSELRGLIQDNTDAIEAHKDAIDDVVITLVGEDVNKSVRTIANEELVKQLIPESAQESLDTLEEIAQWIQEHPESASTMNKAIEDLETLVGTLPEDATATTVVGYVDEVVAEVKSTANGAVQEVVSGTTNGTIAVDGTDVAVTGLGAAAYKADTDFDSAGSANAAEVNSKKYADDLNTAMTTKVDEINTKLTEVESNIPEVEAISPDEINALFE